MKNVMMFPFRMATILLPLSLLPATEVASRAAEPAKKCSIGDRVVQRNREFSLRVGERGIDRKVPIDIWCVDKIDGATVWISAEYLGIVGRTTADQVIRVDRAIAYFSDQIRERTDDAFNRVIRAELWLERGELNEAMADCSLRRPVSIRAIPHPTKLARTFG